MVERQIMLLDKYNFLYANLDVTMIILLHGIVYHNENNKYYTNEKLYR